MAGVSEQDVWDCLSDKWWRLENLYQVINEDSLAVPFRLRPMQRTFIENLWYRNLLLKARQIGYTTLLSIYALDNCLFVRNYSAGIVAHTREDVAKIFDTKVRFAYDSLPEDLKARIPAERSRTNELKFANGSSIRVGTSMRSGTLQFLHISEYGKLWAQFPKKAKEVQTGSLPTVHGNGIIVIESTAEGIGGDFHAKSVQAEAAQQSIAHGNREGLANKEYRFHFYGWWQKAENATPKPNTFEFGEDDLEYFSLVESITGTTLSDAQRYWYVIARRELGDSDMKQEHPSYPSEAFLFSGRKAFEAKALADAMKICTAPRYRELVKAKKRQKHREGHLYVWSEPSPERSYVIGADVAEGLEHGDYSCFDVLNDAGVQVAHFHAHVAPAEFARILDHVGRWYNNAMLGPERNNHGHAVIQKLVDLRYPRIFKARKLDLKRDEVEAGARLGWLTTSKSKPLIIDHLDEALRQGESGIQNADTVNEMQQFIVNARGNYEASANCHDDRVMSYAIALEVLRLNPRRGKVVIPDDVTDWRAA